jgi:hypothetical protein
MPAVGDALVMNARGLRAVGVASKLLVNGPLMDTPFSETLRADILQRSSLCAFMEVLGDLACENAACALLAGAGVASKSRMDRYYNRLPPGLATRFTRVWARLQAVLAPSPNITLREVLAAVLPVVARGIALAQRRCSTPEDVSCLDMHLFCLY